MELVLEQLLVSYYFIIHDWDLLNINYCFSLGIVIAVIAVSIAVMVVIIVVVSYYYKTSKKNNNNRIEEFKASEKEIDSK